MYRILGPGAGGTGQNTNVRYKQRKKQVFEPTEGFELLAKPWKEKRLMGNQ